MSRDHDDDGLVNEPTEPVRLLEGNDRAGARARRLLAALPNDEPSAATKARVRRAIARAETPKKTPSWRTVPVIALVLLASTAAVASAGLGGFSKLRLALVAGGEEGSTARTHESEKKERGTTTALPEEPSAPTAPTTTGTAEAQPESVVPAASATAPETIAAPSAAPPAPRGPKTAPALPPSATAAPAPLPADPPREVSQGAALVLEAMRALRKEHDPARATKKLAEYRAHHAGGALDEEALALAIEASGATNDGNTKKLAADYVARYPAGRYAKSAEAVLARE